MTLATSETELPGRYVSSTIRTFSSVDQRRRVNHARIKGRCAVGDPTHTAINEPLR
jgi:hypothetical protein